jgi:hypothetical protein
MAYPPEYDAIHARYHDRANAALRDGADVAFYLRRVTRERLARELLLAAIADPRVLRQTQGQKRVRQKLIVGATHRGRGARERAPRRSICCSQCRLP